MDKKGLNYIATDWEFMDEIQKSIEITNENLLKAIGKTRIIIQIARDRINEIKGD